MKLLRSIISKLHSNRLRVNGLAYFREIDGENRAVLQIPDGELKQVAFEENFHGYIREIGTTRRVVEEEISCDLSLFRVTYDWGLLLYVNADLNIDEVMAAAKSAIMSVKGDADVVALRIINTSKNKQEIQDLENLPSSLWKLGYIRFEVDVLEIPTECEDFNFCLPELPEICSPEIEPEPDFCERVRECLPPFPSDDCTLTVGGDEVCSYTCTPLKPCVRYRFNEEYFATLEEYSGMSFDFVIGSEVLIQIDAEQSLEFSIVTDESVTITREAFLDYLFANIASGGIFEGLFTITRTDDGFIFCNNSDWNDEVIISSTTINLLWFPYQSEFITFETSVAESEINVVDNEGNAGITINIGFEFFLNSTFQIFQNGEWVTIPNEEIVDGVYTSSEEFTAWRILDQEENVVASGVPTVECTGGSTEVTQSKCEWLQDHETRIEALENNPSGLTCDTLAECAIITEIIEGVEDAETLADNALNAANTAQSDANTALNQISNLATVASSGDYNDLLNKPDLTIYQTKDKVVSASQTAVNDENYTVVATSTFTDPSPTEGKGFTVIVRNGTATVGGVAYAVAGTLIRRIFHSGNWTNYVYYSGLKESQIAYNYGILSHTGNTDEQILQTKTIQPWQWDADAMYQITALTQRSAGSITFRMYLNTVNNLSGSPLKIYEFVTAVAAIGSQKHFFKNGDTFNSSAATVASDIGVNDARSVGTLATSSNLFLIVTIQGSTVTANGAFQSYNISKI